MAANSKPRSATQIVTEWADGWIARFPKIERPIFLLRWLALLLVLVLAFFDRSTVGVTVTVPQMVLIVAGYNLLLLLLMRYVAWVRRPLNYLAVDTVVATLAVYLTGGYHSSFFVLFVFITIGVAFHLELVPTVIVTLGLGLIHIGACYFNPAGLQSPYAEYMLAAKLFLLLVVAVLCGLLLEQLRREHTETERERALAQRLKALNDIFQQLSTTLDLSQTLQTVAQAPRSLLGADMTAIALMDDVGQHLWVAAASGVDSNALFGQHWQLDQALVSTILSSDEPQVLESSQQISNALPAELAELETFLSSGSVVSVPLRLDAEPLGVLDVATSKLQAFDEEDLAFLQALGQEAALAIRNARLYEREKEQVARLRALDEAQAGFVSAVSHELRTPLTCVKTSVDLLDATKSDLSEDQVELVKTIGHHVGRLEGLVADLLDITKLEAGQIALSRQPTDLRRIVVRSVETLRPLVDRKEQGMHVRCPDAITLALIDRRRIEQVLTNILSNAIKFTPKEGVIEVSVSEQETLDEIDQLRVCVADNGPGIPEADLARVFDRFYVVSDGRGLSGVGLGLYIARQIVELHGGRIWAESEVGVGSVFCFSLPVAPGKGLQ
jgi:K+-sensing histidine kinase KdpD